MELVSCTKLIALLFALSYSVGILVLRQAVMQGSIRRLSLFY